VNVFNNVILARNRQLPDDDRMIETCRSIVKSFNVNNLSVCIGWCADQKLTSSRLTEVTMLSFLHTRPLEITNFFIAQQPLVGQGLLRIEASRSHSDTPHLVGLFWTSDQPGADTSI